MKLFDEKVIGRNIAKRRKAIGLTQAGLSSKTDGKVPATSICRYEKGSQKPSLETIYYFAQALECSIDELVTSENGKYAVSLETRASSQEATLSALATLIEGGALTRIEVEDNMCGDFYIAQGDKAVRDFVDEFYKILSLKDTAGDTFETLKQRCISNYAQKWFEDLAAQAEEAELNRNPFDPPF